MATIPNRLVWGGRAASALPILFLLLDAIGKLAKPAPVIEGCARLGYSESSILALGAIELVCTLVHVVPQTALLGAVLLTGFLGGAVASHVRVADPLASHTFFPVYVGALLWGGLFLRDARLRALVLSRS